MNTFLIGYDLDKPGQNYESLDQKIKALGAWWHHLDSTWLVKSDLDSKTIRDELTSVLDDNDELLVIDVTGKAAAWYGFNERGSEWLRNNL